MVKIIADSTCDLSPELISKYDIEIIPLHIVLDDKEYEDGKTITPDEIYEWADANKTTPKTSAAGIEQVIEVLRPYVEKGDDIIVLTISASMSTTNNVMRLAAAELEAEGQVYVVDSANLSTGGGLLVLEACDMVAEGKSAAEIVERLEELKPLVRASFVVDTLTYLHRGGRCSGVAALAGGVLKLHPIIVVESGAMKPAEKLRGKMSKVILDYAKSMEEDLKKAQNKRVFITHSGCDQEILDNVQQYLSELGKFQEIIITRAGGVISSHCGPGTLGVLFIAGE
ncbi:MAG: DegV family protein [Agathobacter sp.]|nr:DegV family protein [Agathobacter sp.]